MHKLGESLDMRVHYVSGEHGAYILCARRLSVDIYAQFTFSFQSRCHTQIPCARSLVSPDKSSCKR